MGIAGFALPGQLPGMERRAYGASGAARLHSWHDPAHIAHIGRADAACTFRVDGHDLVAQNPAGLDLEAMADMGRGDVVLGQGRLELRGETTVRLVEFVDSFASTFA